MTRPAGRSGARCCWSSRRSSRPSRSGISSLDEEFLANIVLPDNTTAGDWRSPRSARRTAPARCRPCCRHKTLTRVNIIPIRVGAR